MLNVLIVSGGGFQGSTLISGLKNSRQITIHLADCFEDNINRHDVDKFHRVPFISSEDDFIRSLVGIIQKEDIHIIFPSTDYELEILSLNKLEFLKYGAKTAVSDYGILTVLNNKIRTYEFLAKNRFPVLKPVDFKSERIDFPIIGKPARGFGGKGIKIVMDNEGFNILCQTENFDHYLWTRCLSDFEEFSVDFAIGFERQVSPIVIRKRIRTSGGFAVVAKTENDPFIFSEAKRLASILGEHGGAGLFNVQFLKPAKDQYIISDINPRVGTSSVFSLGTGISLPLFVCDTDPSGNDDPMVPGPRHISAPVMMIRNLKERWIRTENADNIKGVVFDLDDTIIDQKQWIFGKIELLYDHFYKALPEKREFVLSAFRFIEEGKRSSLIDAVIKKFDIPHTLRDEMIHYYRQSKPDSISIYRDVHHNIAALKQKGFKLAILTDNPVASQEQKLSLIPFLDLFDTIVLSGKFKREKPDKFLFDQVASELKTRNDELVMIGDNLFTDIYGSLKAGYRAAYYIEREGAFYNFCYDSFIKAVNEPDLNIHRIKTINDVFYSLTGNS